MQNKRIKFTELILLLFVWLVLLFTPILFRQDIYSPVRRSIFNQMQIIIPLIVLFIINRFILVPFIFFRNRQVFYVFTVLTLIVLFTTGLYLYNKNFSDVPPFDNAQYEDQMRTPPYAFPGGADPFGNLRPAQTRQKPLPPFANFLIFAILIVGFDTGLLSGLRSINIENEKTRLEKENMAAQLVLLRNQVSPHFLMNTLNNIHSLVDINSEEAKEAIIKLSKMMRYLLYETETEKTTLRREVEFLESYIDLMKLRFNEKVRIGLKLPDEIPDKTIPPFIFISLIENAFKHGVSYKDESFISIDLSIEENRLLLNVENSKSEKSRIEEFSGIGIENTRKRLALLYGDKYHMGIVDGKEIFRVNLSVPL